MCDSIVKKTRINENGLMKSCATVVVCNLIKLIEMYIIIDLLFIQILIFDF